MKERPILFNDAMVRAILEGRKTQTRRPVTLREFQPSRTRGCDFTFRRRDGVWEDVRLKDMLNPPRRGFPGATVFGVPGDRLWVRETFVSCDASVPSVLYRADSGDVPMTWGCADCTKNGVPWRPSIHMPRWASRLTLEVESVRIERLHEITEDGAKAEGLKAMTKDGSLAKWGIPDRDGWPGRDDDGWAWHDWCRYPRDAFKHLWRSIYGAGTERGDYGWDANPLVWVCTFKVVPS